MESHDSRFVAKILEAYVGNLIAESNFFSDLSSGRVTPEDVRGVFGQYYLWRNQFHRWFGICVARIAPFGESLNVPRILGELIECLGQEIREDHHGLALSFLAALGIDDPSRIVALPVTDTYGESFLRCYFSGDRSGDDALAALAGVNRGEELHAAGARWHARRRGGLRCHSGPPVDGCGVHGLVRIAGRAAHGQRPVRLRG